MAQAQVIIVDHSTGKVTMVGGDTAAKAELASALMEQAQAIKSAAAGTPPPRDSRPD